ncbi:MAG: UDP-N-acetylenolpyruvoylglucosamine reductase [Acidobacteria bacterium]|nr:MAG: UDP-N-acetylenolpyruvoylglucosamine reductase [Acidobacteriota bacterium]
MKIQENIPLAPLTTLKVGGPARFYTRPTSEEEIADAFDHALRYGLDVFVLGGGSNILVSDRGFDGLVIHVGLKGIFADGPRITANAGEDWDSLVMYCVDRELAGVECLSGIPGFVGGTPVQNVGAYGQEVSESIVSVRCFDRESCSVVDLANSDCGFKYRTSIFNSTEIGRYVVLSVKYELIKNGEPKIAYKDLREHFGEHRPTLLETRNAVIEIRRKKSMVIDEGDPNSRSAGSFFKNPIVERSQYDSIASASDDPVPHFPADDDRVKVPAAWLIERSGFHKGYRVGNAGISTKHSLALVNLGGASAAEIIALKEKIQHAVNEKFDIILQPEPIFVGFE